MLFCYTPRPPHPHSFIIFVRFRLFPSQLQRARLESPLQLLSPARSSDHASPARQSQPSMSQQSPARASQPYAQHSPAEHGSPKPAAGNVQPATVDPAMDSAAAQRTTPSHLPLLCPPATSAVHSHALTNLATTQPQQTTLPPQPPTTFTSPRVSLGNSVLDFLGLPSVRSAPRSTPAALHYPAAPHQSTIPVASGEWTGPASTPVHAASAHAADGPQAPAHHTPSGPQSRYAPELPVESRLLSSAAGPGLDPSTEQDLRNDPVGAALDAIDKHLLATPHGYPAVQPRTAAASTSFSTQPQPQPQPPAHPQPQPQPQSPAVNEANYSPPLPITIHSPPLPLPNPTHTPPRSAARLAASAQTPSPLAAARSVDASPAGAPKSDPDTGSSMTPFPPNVIPAHARSVTPVQDSQPDEH